MPLGQQSDHYSLQKMILSHDDLLDLVQNLLQFFLIL
jgi:hypothetical protein